MNLQRYPRAIRAGFGLAGSLAVAGLVVVTLAFGQGYFDEGYELSAVFPTSSQGLFTDGGSTVKLRGVNVGQVSSIELLDDGRAEVRLFIRDGVAIPETASASIEPLSVFGPKFVRLDPGDAGPDTPTLGDGDEIERVSTAAELTDILAATTELFEHVDPHDIVVIVDALAEGTAGLGPQFGASIDASGALLTVAADHEADLRQLLADAAVLSGTFADHGDDIVSIGDDLDTIVAAALDDPDRLDALLESAIGISTSFTKLLRDNQADIDVTLRAVAAFLADLRVEAHRLPDVIDLLGTFFGRLSDIIRIPGPGGKQLGALRGFMSLDLCLVYGLCVGGTGVTAASGPGLQATEARLLRAMHDAHPAEGELVAFADLLTGSRR